MNFSDLDFKPHPYVPGEKSVQAIHLFQNGYGVSVVRFPGSYGYENGMYELAVLKGNSANDYDLCYDSPITDDVLGHLSEEQVDVLLHEIESL